MSEFVTVYPKHGAGRVHSAQCAKAQRGERRPFNPAATRNGIASVASCCRQHEAEILAIPGAAL